MPDDRKRRITIEPATRLEGHGRVEVFLDETGEVEHAYFQVPELRGFEKFVEGRPAEEMPQITSRICGVCPMAHHMASVKALDSLYGVTPPPAARKIRELVYNAFLVEDHALQFYFLGGPDFLVGPSAPAAERNVLGAIAKLGSEAGRRVIAMRRRLREITATAGGKAIHPVLGLPGGVARRIRPEERDEFRKTADEAVEFAAFTLATFRALVLGNSQYVEMIRSDPYTHRTHYMSIVDASSRLAFSGGDVRVVSPSGSETMKFAPESYADYIVERAEPWSYMKFTYLKTPGWKGFVDGEDSGIYSVGPLARLNVCEGIGTPLAAEAYEEYLNTLGPKPVHHTLANHWARIIEMLHAAERLKELAGDPELVSPEIRALPERTPSEGIGAVEAPRGTLIHHYQTDERGIIRRANLIVATQNNAARLAMSVERAARGFVSASNLSDGALNRIEMAVRAYDPCLGCATHETGRMPLIVRVRRSNGSPAFVCGRDANGLEFLVPA